MKFVKLPRLRRLDHPLEYDPAVQDHLQRAEREFPRPAHLGVR